VTRPALLALSWPLWIGGPAGLAAAPAPVVQVETVDVGSEFGDAVALGALKRACARNEAELRSHFLAEGKPFDPDLVRSRGGRRCHVDYSPTLPGFRADPEDAPVRELFMNVDGLALLSGREEVFGDVLDISRQILAGLPRPVHLTLGTGRDLAGYRYEEALAFQYGDRAALVDWRRTRVPALSNPWTQDFLKSGKAGGEERILVTRQLFEGHVDNATAFAPMLDALSEDRFVRSKLSWEGGDLQFVRHPENPELLVMLFGDSARAYWGEDLDPDEYAYVLRREFGADLSVDLGGLVPHVDYFVAFLPADRIALVSQPVSGRRDLAEAAAAAIEARFRDGAPASLCALREALADDDALRGGRKRVESLLKRARREAQEGWPRDQEPGLGERLAPYLARLCPQSPADCFRDEAVESFLDSDPALLRDWVQAALRDRTDAALDLRLLSVVESQLMREPVPTQGRIDEKAREIESLGFRVVRVPRIGGERSLKVPWSGISYVNSLVVDDVLFVPRFGLGAAEERIFDELAAALPDHYRIVPVAARHMLLFNGGVHCSLAELRD